MCCVELKIITNSVLGHLLATFFCENSKKCETKGFCHHFFLQYTPNNVYWRLGTKNNAYKHQNIFSPMFPKTMGGKYKKTMPRIFGLQKHNQDQRIKIINNKIFCSSLCVLSVGKALYLPRFRSKNSALATEATKRKWRQLTPPVKSSFTDVRKLQMWVFVSLEN